MTDHSHVIDDQSRLSKLARICKMSIPTLRAMMPLRIPYDDLKQLTFGDAQVCHEMGVITEDDWGRYCYDFRDLAFRFSNLGKAAAAVYAQRNGLPLPMTDRP